MILPRLPPQWSTADAPIFREPRVSKLFPLRPVGGQKIAMHASLTARNYFLELISTIRVHSPTFFPNLSRVFPVLAVANAGSCVVRQNEIGRSR